MRSDPRKRSYSPIRNIYAIAFARTNEPLSSERTWTLFHQPLFIHNRMETNETGTLDRNRSPE